MTREEYNGYAIVLPQAGMLLTDGQSISEKIYAPLGDDLANIHEVTPEEAAEIEARNQSNEEEEQHHENL